MRVSSRYIFILFIFFAWAETVSAHIPLVVTQENLHDIVTISNPDVSQAFYGELVGFPHTYEIEAKEPFTLTVEVLMPDIDSSNNTVSGIVVRNVTGSGRVTEVTRLLAKGASWSSFFEPWGGDSYRRGGTFSKEVEAGTYRIELSTPVNLEKYVLVVGEKEESDLGYFETLERIMDVKVFFGKSRIMVIQSPLAYVPLLILFCILGFVYYRRRRQRTEISHGS